MSHLVRLSDPESVEYQLPILRISEVTADAMQNTFAIHGILGQRSTNCRTDAQVARNDLRTADSNIKSKPICRGPNLHQVVLPVPHTEAHWWIFLVSCREILWEIWYEFCCFSSIPQSKGPKSLGCSRSVIRKEFRYSSKLFISTSFYRNAALTICLCVFCANSSL